jgi:hypothetical protein
MNFFAILSFIQTILNVLKGTGLNLGKVGPILVQVVSALVSFTGGQPVVIDTYLGTQRIAITIAEIPAQAPKA